MLGRHLDWCLDTARVLGAELEGPRVQEALEALDADVDNLHAAMDWGITYGRGLDAARIVAATSWYWVWRGRIGETERWLQRACIDDTTLDPTDRLALLWARSELIGNRAGAIADLMADGLELARAHHDLRAEARLLVSHSRYRAFSAPHETIEQAPIERAPCREVGDMFWAATSYVGEALAQISLGRFDLAEPLLDQLRIEARTLRHPQLIADEIARRAVVDRRFGRYDAVHRGVVDIDRITFGFTTLNSQALVHAQAALVDVAQGRAAVALDAMDELYRRYLVAGELGYLPSIALPMIDALIDLGRAGEALDRFERLWDGFSKTISWRLRLGSVRGTAMLASGDLDAARAPSWPCSTRPGPHPTTTRPRSPSATSPPSTAPSKTRQRRRDTTPPSTRDTSSPRLPAVRRRQSRRTCRDRAEHRRPRPASVLLGAAATIRAGAGVTRTHRPPRSIRLRCRMRPRSARRRLRRTLDNGQRAHRRTGGRVRPSRSRRTPPTGHRLGQPHGHRAAGCGARR